MRGPQKVEYVEDQRNRAKGIVVHALFDEWIKGGCEPGWMRKNAPKTWWWLLKKNGIVFPTQEERDKRYFEMMEGIDLLEKQYTALGLNKFSAETEKFFNVPFKEGSRLLGMIDLFYADTPHGPMIGDLKFTKYKKFFDTDQLFFYALAMHIAGVKIKYVFNWSPYLPPEFHRVTATNLKLVVEKIDEMLRLSKGEVFTLAPDANTCWGCPVQGVCPKYAKHEAPMLGAIVFGATDESMKDLLAGLAKSLEDK
jgi:hypothetical protein